jgi:23S rRNA G2445 N2-methylase RlmL
MARRPISDEELKEAVKSRGFAPARAELEALVARLAGDDEALVEAAERALARLGADAMRVAIARVLGAGVDAGAGAGAGAGEPARPPARGRLTRLVGRVAQEHAGAADEARAFLLARLDDADAKTRRNAIIALGKLGGEPVERALIAAWAASDVPAQRSIAAALGKVGGEPARALLDAVVTDDAELARIVAEARLKLARTLGRATARGRVAAERVPDAPLPVLVHCREGLETIVAHELVAADESSTDARSADVAAAEARGPGVVAATLRGPIASLYRSRAMLRFGFPLPVRAGAALEDAVVDALASDHAWRIMSAFTDGAPRYRIEWASGGHRRGLTFRCARAVARRRPELLNDPTDSLWVAFVTEPAAAPAPRAPAGDAVAVELWPRGLADERFAYRRAHVPASSHPTLAAALAHVAGARADDVVWDPFVGAATELIERARLGPYRRLVGSDLDDRALERARDNLAAAGVHDVELAAADARRFAPRGVTLIVTNPPMGRRVLNKQLTGALYDEFLDHAAALLPRGGRLVWISPRAQATHDRAERAGLRTTFRRRVDMGGFWGELQAFVKR